MSVSNYEEFVAALAAGGTVYLSKNAVITLTASTQIKHSKTRITSKDPKHPGKLILESGASWSGPLLYANGLTNLTFDNFIIDGNFDSQGGKPRGKGYFNLCNLKNCDNIVIHDMQMRDGGCDGFQFRGCKYIKAYNNKIEYLGHDAFYFIGSNAEIEVYNNNVLTFTNSAVRLAYGCTNAWIHDNHFHSVFTGGSTGPAIQIDKHGFSGILIEDNVIENVNGCSIWMTGDALNKGSIVIRNCVFKNTGVYKSYTGYSNAAIVNGNMDGVLVENCTFIDGNVGYSTFDRNGLSVSFNATFKNCIFYSAAIAAFRMADSGGSAKIINCNFYGNKAIIIDDYTANATFSGSTSVDPQLTTAYAVGEDSPLYGKGIGYKSVTQVQPVENDEVIEDPVNTKTTSARLMSASATAVLANGPYIDVGKSATSTYRSLFWTDLSAYKTPIYKAELQLCWYYPAGKTRVNDSIIEVYRPTAWNDKTATWNKNANTYFDRDGNIAGSKSFGSITIDNLALPDNKYKSLDVTDLVNKYISGAYPNTGFLIKTALENNDYIAFYSNTHGTLAPKLVITAVAPTTDVKIAVADSRRFKENQSTSVLDNNVYLDVGKSNGAARFQLAFDVSQFTKPVESARLQLAWYYPAGKSRLADTVVTAYRPLASLSDNMTWVNSANNFAPMKAYGSVTLKAAILPDGKFESIDITELVNAYISGTYQNTGVFIKALNEGNNYVAFHGESAIDSATKPYILIKTTETLK